MQFFPADAMTVASRRQGRRLAYWNAGLWALGNGLASTLLVVYLALELGAPGLGVGVGLILAAPNLAGVLRLATPSLVRRLGDRKRFCAGGFAASAAVLAALPWLASPQRFGSPRESLAALVAIWCAYHLLQYVATIALWSWLADLVHVRVRGRFIGRRDRWMVLGQAAGMFAAAIYAWGRHSLHPAEPRLAAYVALALLGAGFMLAAIVPLMKMPRAGHDAFTRGTPGAHGNGQVRPVRSLSHGRGSDLPRGSVFLAPFRDRAFRRLLVFGCWFSLANGITQSADRIYPERALGFGLGIMLALMTGMRLGQFLIGPTMGRLADRLGNRPVMLVSLLVVAQGPLFYLLAGPSRPWWIGAAWFAWIAYAGLNVCLPNLMLKLAPAAANTPHIAAYYTVTGLCYAASTIAGGALYDRLRLVVVELPGMGAWDYFACLFLAGWIVRMLGAVILLGVTEPKPRFSYREGAKT
jgi:Na+/melibiose symporter-like transporter